MASLRFRYSPMNAGKSSNLLQVAHNYQERGMNTIVIKPSIDTKGDDSVVGRGMKDSRKVDFLVPPTMNIYSEVISYLHQNAGVKKENNELMKRINSVGLDSSKLKEVRKLVDDYLLEHDVSNSFESILAAVLVDEAQFLTEEQVKQLSDVAIILDIPVICFGLRTDFKGNLFPGSEALFRFANSLEELTTICVCGRKALHNARMINGEYVHDGEQVAIDEKADVSYISLCPIHYREYVYGIDVNKERAKLKKLILK